METDALKLWQRYKERTTFHDEIGLSLDLSRVDFADDFFEQKTESINKAFAAMAELEQGAIANPDENRMVGHYWLRNPELDPSDAFDRSPAGGAGPGALFCGLRSSCFTDGYLQCFCLGSQSLLSLAF